MICTYCEQEMLDATSCVLVPVKAGGGELEPVRYGSEKREASWDRRLRRSGCAAMTATWSREACITRGRRAVPGVWRAGYLVWV